MTRIAIIGAGITGLSLAHLLQNDAEVTVFEKARGLAGRMAGRRTDQWQFDHGAQFFTARSRAFRHFLVPYLDAGLVQEWRPRVTTLVPGARPYRRGWFEPHYIGVPTMASLARSLAAPLAVVLQHEVRCVERRAETVTPDQVPAGTDVWCLRFADGQLSEPFDWVISTVPAPMAVQMFPDEFSGMSALRAVRYAPCFSAMLGFDAPLSLTWDAAKVRESAVGWIVRTNSRPGRPSSEALLLHSNHDWAAANADLPLPDAMNLLEHSLKSLPGLEGLPAATSRQLHRWRYAELLEGTDQQFYVDLPLQLAACGDWGLKGDVESAWLSAHLMHGALEGMLEHRKARRQSRSRHGRH